MIRKNSSESFAPKTETFRHVLPPPKQDSRHRLSDRDVTTTKYGHHWVLLVLAGLLLAVPAFAHSPFASSSRAVLTTNGLEIHITTGEALAVSLLNDVSPNAHGPAAPGRLYSLPSEFAGRLYAVTLDLSLIHISEPTRPY